MATVSSEAVAVYQTHIEKLARKNAGLGGAEFDDLVQEGLIFVWQSLARGITPSTELIEGRMLNWIRFLRRLNAHHTPISYETMLPLDDYSAIPG